MFAHLLNHSAISFIKSRITALFSNALSQFHHQFNQFDCLSIYNSFVNQFISLTSVSQKDTVSQSYNQLVSQSVS